MTIGHYFRIVRRKIYREDILKAGLELMFLNGYNATGIKEITDKVQIPKGSFYNHFHSKEEFGLEVVKSYCDNGVRMFEAHFLDISLPPLQRFDNFFSSTIKNYKESLNCKLGCVMSNFSTEMADVNENFRVLLDEEFNRCELIMAQCIQEAILKGDINKDINSKVLAHYILNSWHGALVRMKTTGTVTPLENFKTLTLDKLLI